MFEGIFIGRYTSELNRSIHEGDIVNFTFKEPGKHAGFQIGQSKGVVKYNIQRSSFEIIVKSDSWDYNTHTVSKYDTKLTVSPFYDNLEYYPVVDIVSIEGSIYIDDKIGYQEIADTINELVFLRDVSTLGFSKDAKRALFSAINILNKVKGFLTT